MSLSDEDILEVLPALRRYARFLVGPQEAEDLVNTTAVKLLSTRDRFSYGNPEGWATHIMHQIWIDLKAVKKTVNGVDRRVPRVIPDQLNLQDHETKPGVGPSPEESLYSKEVCQVIDTMSDEDITLLTMTAEGYRPVEIAALVTDYRDHLHVSRRLFDARRRLLERLR